MDLLFSKESFELELTGNILPFWMIKAVDPENGGFYGSINNEMKIDNSAPRSAVLYSRILWTYSRAYRLYKNDEYLRTAQYTLDYIRRNLFDPEFGGVFWSVDRYGKPADDRKHTYAQAFTLYGLSEYYRATGEAASLNQAKELYHLIERHTHDPIYGGNIECCSRSWQAEADMRLSAKDLNCAKSMNTLLHLIEAYTNLISVCKDEELIGTQKALLRSFIEHIVDPQTHHLKLFFSSDWQSLEKIVSYGHDIEASWLVVEAAEELEDPELISTTRELAVKMAQATLDEGRNPDGSILYELNSKGLVEDRHWWVNAEAVVGFYNVYSISGNTQFAAASENTWKYIREHFIDQENGDWFKVIKKDGTPSESTFKVGPWECPYHHSRLCMEMSARLEEK